jgi:hypothetical protein
MALPTCLNTGAFMTIDRHHAAAHVRRHLIHTALAGALVSLGGLGPAWAQTQAWPDKPVKFLIPYPPGGATDVIGRVLAQRLSTTMGQQFVVDNRGGAGGSLGASVVAKAPADGYTLLMGALTSHSINAALNPQAAGFDIQKSFAYVSIVGTVPLAFVVNPSVKANSLQELIALAKANPKTLAFASSGNGSPQHLATDQIVAPPSRLMKKIRPWTLAGHEGPAFEARYTAAPAISSGSPMRRSGTRHGGRLSVSGLSHRALAKSVRIRPGAMQLTRTLCGPYSQARLRASCMSAALLMQ